MAIYEYKCKACGLTESVSRGISEQEIVPNCSTCEIKLNRVYSSVGVTFSGSGFYSTDKGK
jgi:putative FmdB family regulatory protein